MAAIAISREIGTAGTDVGHAVARALGCSCVDREVILEAAARYQVAAGALTDVEEHPPSFWQRFDRERRRNLVFIRAALLERLASGACVVTGRVVPLLLRDVAAVLRVRVVASADARVRRIMEEREVAEETARAEIDAAEQELAALVQWLFGLDARDSTPYDVIVSTDRLGVEGSAAVILRSAEAAGFRPDAAALASLRDHALAAAVHAALARDRTLGALAIEVSAADGCVTLGGAVIGPGYAARARAVAASVPGVRDVGCRSAAPVPIPPVERL